MNAHAVGELVLVLGGLGIAVWLLAKLGHTLAKIAEAVAAAAVIFVGLWLVVRATAWVLRQVVTRWRTSLGILVVVVWWHWLGWLSLVVLVGAVAVSLASWRLADAPPYDRVGRPAPAGLVAAVDGLRAEAARLVARLRPVHA